MGGMGWGGLLGVVLIFNTKRYKQQAMAYYLGKTLSMPFEATVARTVKPKR